MSINAATSSSSQVSSSSAVSTSSSAESSKKTSTDSSFKNEMDKVSSQEQKTAENQTTENQTVENNVPESEEKKESSVVTEDKSDTFIEGGIEQNLQLEGNIDFSKFASMSVLDANSMLADDIRQMMGINSVENSGVTNANNDFLTLDYTNNVSVTASDAEFFIDLTQNNEVSVANITAQAQAMLNNGADVAEVRQNVQISQTLLNAINTARENNQPLRIDFDQNVSVILRINREGVISANFIPGDKAVEQYLRNNISSLRASFEEQELPYSDLSYSNRGSKQQKENRRNNNDK